MSWVYPALDQYLETNDTETLAMYMYFPEPWDQQETPLLNSTQKL